MSVISSPALFMGEDGYQISRSVRLRSSASAYFSKTLTTPTNNKIFTWSGWVKRGLLGGSISYPNLFGTGSDELLFYSATYTDELAVNMNAGVSCNVVTTQVFRDPSAWYHIIVAVDTTQATASNRVKIYVNGVQVTSFATATYPSLNYSPSFNSAVAHNIGNNTTGRYFDGYLTEVNFIDGQALTPSSFGENDSITGVWKPKKYAGTYGTNGFYLNFSDNSNNTAATIGKDYSGNGNNWTPNNISVTSGVTYDSMIDTPTPYADGGNGRGNYCVWNAVAQPTVVNGTVTRSNGNLTSADGATTYGLASFGTIAASSGKWYWEVTLTSAGGTYANIGVVIPSSISGSTHSGIVYAQNGNKGNASNPFGGSGSTAYGATYTTGNVIGVALDIDGGTITFYKDGVSQGVAYSTGIAGSEWTPAVGDGQNSTSYTFDLNCGQRPFAYTPPSGFKALNTQNLPEGSIKAGNKYFDATAYVGTGASLSVTNSGSMQPDLVWVKSRSTVENNFLFDSVRGSAPNYNYLSSNLTNAEATPGVSMLTAINSNGFTLGTNGGVNTNAATLVGWQWKAGGTSSSNTSGSITSTVSVNATAGFSIVTYTGNNSTATIGHGLGVAPSMIIIKDRSQGVGYNWNVYHASIGNTQRIFLDSTSSSIAGVWNNTSPTSTVFTVINNPAVNGTDNYVAYCWAAVAGYSAFGSYTGNGSSDGPFVYCGFRPRWLMVKRTSSGAGTANWVVLDTSRDTYNLSGQSLEPNLSDAEYTPASSGYPMDILSNGFKQRGSSVSQNESGSTYIFAAFAENPFKNSLAR